MTLDLRKFGEDCQRYGECLGRIRERRRIAELLLRDFPSFGAARISTVLEIVNSEPIPNLPAPLMPEEKKP